ncbi:YHYH protein [Winogradskyella endarachnes]|uniref:YHYH protein n=1 Tax=Winogradskyella endarachnes TaxID=2681965 RepID=A0A6L6U8R2_9FLAO|nr:YHYH protein [Winogradskyella endarachnes]MUU78419.1 YHYH protein [Winogradskyella endarachnes]
MIKRSYITLAIISIGLFACNNDDSNDNDGGDSSSEESTIVLNTSLFSEYSRTSDFELVDCTLSDGTVTQCYKVVYENIRETVTVICPENEGEVGGLGVYNGVDGITNPGLRALDNDLWADFATDGYDIINDDGTINIQIPAGGPGSGFIEAGSGISGSCLDAELDESYLITYYIPAYPVKTTIQTTTNSLDYWGISLDGFPFAEQPPSSASQVGVAIPGLDGCGGHPQPDGPYHYHLIPQVIDDLLEDQGITNVNCSYIDQSSNTILGYARDGFPMYGTEDYDGSTPDDLDDCNGHTHETDEFPDGIYHYHITNIIDSNSDTGYTNILPCTYGANVASENFSSVQ